LVSEPSLKQPWREIGEELAPDCPNVRAGTFHPHVRDASLLQSLVGFPYRQKQKIITTDSDPQEAKLLV
jgi:hypothetical protein